MSKKYLLLTTLSILLAMVIFGLSQAWAENYATYLITKNSYGNYPKINDNGEIVWMGENGKIYLYSTGKISIIANQGKYPDINNNGQITYANGEIYLYQNGSTKNISNNGRRNYWPFINYNGQVAWYSVDSIDNVDNFRIHLYKDNNPFIIREHNNCRNPRLNDLGQIVWKEFDVNGEYIFFYNGSNSSKIGGPGVTPDINNDGKIVWVGQGGVILYDNNTPINIISDGLWPRINNTGNIIYEKVFGPGPVFPDKICLYNNGNITEIANNAYISYPDINNSGQIVWAGYDGTHYRIYLAQPTSFPPPIVPLVPSNVVPIITLLLNE